MESPRPSDPATTHSRAAMWAVESERRVARARDNEALRQANDELEERVRARTAELESMALMAGGIAHDFNNLLEPDA